MQRRILFNSNGINSNKTYRGFALPYMREEHGVVAAVLICILFSSKRSPDYKGGLL